MYQLPIQKTCSASEDPISKHAVESSMPATVVDTVSIRHLMTLIEATGTARTVRFADGHDF